MNFKKLMALILALIMVTALFGACGKETTDDDKNNKNDHDDSDAISGLLFIDGEEVDTTGLIMMTVDGVEIPFDEYRYMYMVLDNNYFSYGDAEFWASNAELFPTLLDYTADSVIENNWGYMLANKYGIDFTEEDLDEIEAGLADERAYFDSEEEFYAALEESGFTEDLLRRLIAQQIMCNRAYEELYGKEGALLVPSDDEIRTALMEDYVRVYHVLAAFDSFDGDKDLALEVAQDMLERLKDGEDIYEMAQNESDDPGMYDNVDGYFFTYNKMVEPFEKAAFALEVGELSDIVETSYGYHIILRLEQEEYIDENWDSVREEYINTIFNKEVDEMISNAEVVYSEYCDKLTYDSIR